MEQEVFLSFMNRKDLFMCIVYIFKNEGKCKFMLQIFLIPVPCIFYYSVLWPTNAQLSHKLSHSSYMFWHYRVILSEPVTNTLTSNTNISNAALGSRELAINTLPTYTSISNAAVGNAVNCITNRCIWNTCVTWQGIDYKLPDDDKIVSKHEGGVW